MEQKGQEWVKKHNMRMLACQNNHRGDVESVRSRSKELRMSGVADEQLQQLSMDYPMSELSQSWARS
ncbi:hypothetical protein HAX54_001421 [Datura stramonium]|uniref:Uncharacterized protein n=1 Tax=Datura stramonium TaxID=4076 RepID=A0ABS8WQP5_DATST|nr:hypothetical protein [Datura stramonium]